jgi:hypothetical protein
MVADIAHLGQRAKVEVYGEMLFLVLRMLGGGDSLLFLAQRLVSG